METTTRPHRIRRRILAVGIPALTLLVGVGIGASSIPEPVEPRVETKIETETVEVEKRVEVVPAACLAALDRAEDLNGINLEAFDITAEMFDAVAEFDVRRLEAETAKLDALGPEVAAAVAAYNDEADACRVY